jgi:ribosomal protein S18 acetylase RimI-like enzyme
LTTPDISIAPARFPEDAPLVGTLFREYMDGIGVDISFQGTQAELAALPGKYSAPAGLVLIARDDDGTALGCIAVRPLADRPADCEMKRLYVRPAARGRNLGRLLAEAIIAHAKTTGYRRMYLDTLATMQPALRLYASLGFREVAAYYHNPLPGVRYLALDL